MSKGVYFSFLAKLGRGFGLCFRKIAAIQSIAKLSNKKELQQFIGFCNFYRDLRSKRAHTMAPLTSMCSSKATFKWTSECREVFTKTKAAMSHRMTLLYPDYTKPFHIHTDASQFHQGGVINFIREESSLRKTSPLPFTSTS
jgi:hypothetical protein